MFGLIKNGVLLCAGREIDGSGPERDVDEAVLLSDRIVDAHELRPAAA